MFSIQMLNKHLLKSITQGLTVCIKSSAPTMACFPKNQRLNIQAVEIPLYVR